MAMTENDRRARSGSSSGGKARRTAGGGGGGSAGRSGTPNALQKPLRPSEELAAVVGHEPLPRTEAVSRVWAHIKQHGLQDPQNRREIVADDKLRRVFGKDRVTMFEMNKHLARHLA